MSCTVPAMTRAAVRSTLVTAPRPCSQRTDAVGQRDAEVAGERLAAVERPAHVGVDAVAVVGVDAGEERLVARRLEVGIGDAEEPVELVGPRHLAGHEVPLPAAEPATLLGLGELLLAFGHAPASSDSFSRHETMPAALMPEDEAAVDAGPLPRVVDRGRVVVDGRRREHATDAVLEHDVADGDEERPPVLVERDDTHHDEEVEVHLDHAAGQVHERGRAREQPERGDDGADPPTGPQARWRSTRRRRSEPSRSGCARGSRRRTSAKTNRAGTWSQAA